MCHHVLHDSVCIALCNCCHVLTPGTGMYSSHVQNVVCAKIMCHHVLKFVCAVVMCLSLYVLLSCAIVYVVAQDDTLEVTVFLMLDQAEVCLAPPLVTVNLLQCNQTQHSVSKFQSKQQTFSSSRYHPLTVCELLQLLIQNVLASLCMADSDLTIC